MQYPTKTCKECDGTGVEVYGRDDRKRECFVCNGQGEVVDVVLYRNAEGRIRAVYNWPESASA